MRRLRAFLVLAAFFAFTLPLMPLQLLFLATGSRYARSFPHWYHRQVCKIVGIRLNVEGEVAEEQGVLLISNHVSWLDITVLSAVAPVSFVAKQEVASWPFVSWLAKLQRSVFVDRNRRNEVGDKANEILDRLAGGDHIVLFAEGTSSDGNSVVPFKTALFAAAKPTNGPRMGAKVSAQTLATWIWQATPGACSASARSMRISALGRPCRLTLSRTAKRSRAMPRTRSARTWLSYCAASLRRDVGNGAAAARVTQSDYIARRSLIVSSTVAGAKLPLGNCRISPAFTTLSKVVCTPRSALSASTK